MVINKQGGVKHNSQASGVKTKTYSCGDDQLHGIHGRATMWSSRSGLDCVVTIEGMVNDEEPVRNQSSISKVQKTWYGKRILVSPIDNTEN